MNDKLKIIFAGTPEFAVPGLRALINDEAFEVITVITQEDKPIGRKQILTPPPVKVEALKNNLKVLQPAKIKNIKEEISALAPDFFIVTAYGQIIPSDILAIPKYGCINVHASLLPRYRGASVIQAPILNGDKKTGVTIMKMDKGLDTGEIIEQAEIELASDETAETLHDKLAELGAEILPRTLKDFIADNLIPQAQENEDATYVKELTKEDGKIDWKKPAIEIERMVRAFYPWPSTFGQLKIKNEKLKIIKILRVENKILAINKYQVGEIFLDNKQLAIQCGDGALIITKLQLEGGRPLSAEEFLRGHSDFIGKILE